MSKIVGDIAIAVEAETAGLISGLNSGKVSVADFGVKVEQMGKRLKSAEAKSRSMGGAFRNLGNISNRTRAQIQNTSFQLQDIAVQLQGGTKASTALAQQLPQLLGGFGPVGAIMGVLAGVGIPALAFAFSSLGDQTEKTKTDFDNFSKALEQYQAASKAANQSTAELGEQLGVTGEKFRATLQLLSDIALVEAFDALGVSVAAVGAGFEPIQLALANIDRLVKAGEEGGIGYRRAIRGLKDEFNLTVEQARGLAAALEQMKSAKAPEQITTASRALQAVLSDIYGEVSNWPEAFQDVARDVANVELKAGELQATVDGARYSVVEMASAFVGAANAISNNLPPADALLKKTQALAGAAWDYAGAMGAAAPKGGRGGDPRQFTNLDEYRKQLQQQSRWKAPVKPGAAKGSGGGGSAAGPSESELEALRQKFASEQQLLDINLQTTLEKLAEFRDAKMLQEGEFDSLEAKAKKDHLDKMEKLERDKQAAKLQMVGGALGDLSSLMQSGNDKLFKIGQASAVAEAVVSGYSAAVAAWEKGMKVGGPPVAAAFTAASLAKTGALISGISSGSSSGASQSAGGAADASSAVSAGPIQTREFQVRGNNVLGLEELFAEINEGISQGHRIRIDYAA